MPASGCISRRTYTSGEFEWAGQPLLKRCTAVYAALTLIDRSIAQEEKRNQILEAAVRVFASKGYHTARVGDIAKEAGVAHGLLYHYFSSKEEVLHTVFRDNWGRLVAAFEAIDEGDDPPSKQLDAIAKILLRTWRYGPDLVR